MGFYYTTPRLMQTVRRMIDENPAAWTKALKRAQAADLFWPGTGTPARKRGAPPLLDAVYNRKTITMERFEPDPAFFGTAALVDVLKEAFAALVPLYRLLIAAVERDIEQAGDAATA